HNLDAEPLGHLARERFAASGIRAVTADALDWPNRRDRRRLPARLPAGADHRRHPRILAGEILRGQPAGGGDPHALDDAVGIDRQRLARLDAEQQHKPDITFTRCAWDLHALEA